MKTDAGLSLPPTMWSSGTAMEDFGLIWLKDGFAGQHRRLYERLGPLNFDEFVNFYHDGFLPMMIDEWLAPLGYRRAPAGYYPGMGTGQAWIERGRRFQTHRIALEWAIPVGPARLAGPGSAPSYPCVRLYRRCGYRQQSASFTPIWQLTFLPKPLYLAYMDPTPELDLGLDPVAGITPLLAQMVEAWPKQLEAGIRCWQALWQRFEQGVLASKPKSSFKDNTDPLRDVNLEELVKIGIVPSQQGLCQTCPSFLRCHARRPFLPPIGKFRRTPAATACIS